MMINLKCPKCNSKNLENGALTGCVASNLKDFAPSTTQVLFTACTECGYILEFRLKNPKSIIRKFNV